MVSNDENRMITDEDSLLIGGSRLVSDWRQGDT
jgi:hypothetical protein